MGSKKSAIRSTVACGLISLLCIACTGSTPADSPISDDKDTAKKGPQNASAFTLLQELEKQKQTLQEQLRQKEKEINKHKETIKKSNTICRMSDSMSLAGFCDTKKSDQNACEVQTKIKDKDGKDVQLCNFTAGSAATCTFDSHKLFCSALTVADNDGDRCTDFGMKDGTGTHHWNVCSDPPGWPAGLGYPDAGQCETTLGDPCTKIWRATAKTEATCTAIVTMLDLSNGGAKDLKYQGAVLGSGTQAATGVKPHAAYTAQNNSGSLAPHNPCTYQAGKENACLPDPNVKGDPCSEFKEGDCKSQSHGLCASVDLSPKSDDDGNT